MRYALLATALLCSLAACGADTPLVGACATQNRLTADKTYYDLALKMAINHLRDLKPAQATPETVAAQQAYLAQERTQWLPTITDPCLRSHVDHWLAVYERQANNALAERERLKGYSSSFEQEQAEKEAQTRALAERLGVRP